MIIDFEEFDRKKKELKNIEKDIIKLMEEFVILKKLIDPKEFKRISNFKKIDNSTWLSPPKKYLNINYVTNHGWNGALNLDKEQYEDFLEFVKNPELYRAANNYNL